MRKWLRNMRLKNNFKQIEIAKKLDISESYYSQIENGERQKKMSLETAQKIAEIFNVTLDYVLEKENKED